MTHSEALQNPVFEPLYSLQELHFQPNNPAWLIPPSLNTSPFSAPVAATIFNDHESEDSRSDKSNTHIRQCELMHSPSSGSITVAISTPTCAPSRSHSSSDVVDDGSIASKLLNSITKSISSPSLLACCKESVRETPYQKTLMLRRMKLQHCTEEIGSESSDGLPVCHGEYNSIFDSLSTERSSQSTRELSGEHQNSEGNASFMPMISKRSSPPMPGTSLVTSHMKERSFPPPLTHNSPWSNSSDSFTYSLCAYREDGRFILKEVKVPSRKYFESSRRDGRLTLRLLATDEEFESKHSEEDGKEYRGLQEGHEFDMYYGATADVTREKQEGASCVEAANSCNLEVCRERENMKIIGMGSIDLKNGVECLFDKSLLMESPIHLPGRSPNIKVGEDFDVICLECKEVSNGGKKDLLQGFEITPVTSLWKTGYGGSKSASSMIVFKDIVSAKCLIEKMSKLVPSFGLVGGKYG